MPISVKYPVFDADNHMYETMDAFVKYLPPEYDGLVKFVEVNGRTKIALRNVISDYIPNPTFNKVAPPGAQELEFRLKNPSSKHTIVTEGMGTRQFGEASPVHRVTTCVLQSRRTDHADGPAADRPSHDVAHAGQPARGAPGGRSEGYGGRRACAERVDARALDLQLRQSHLPTPVINLSILDEAIRELDYVVERGARAILIRPASVPDYNGRRRSFALPEYDPFWKKVQESGVLVGMHSSDDGAQRYINEWDGATKEFTPFRTPSLFSRLVNSEYRNIRDSIYSIIGHGLATRFPDIRFMPVENGSQWVPTALKQFRKLYDRSPEAFDENPIEAFHRSIFVHPFFEEDVLSIVDLVGSDNVVFGSDYPHPEGLFDPLSFLEEIEPLPEADKAKIMGGTLSKLMQCDPTEKVVAAA